MYSKEELLQRNGASRDFRAIGLGRTAASTYAMRGVTLGRGDIANVVVPSAGDVVALVPLRPDSYVELTVDGFYGRLASLGQAVSVEASYLGFVHDGMVGVLPIVRRAVVGSDLAYHQHPQALAWVKSSVWRTMPEAATVIEVDVRNPVSISLKSGFNPGKYGQATGLAAVRHHRLSDLLAAPRLKGLPQL